MTKENYTKATNILDQLKKLESLNDNIGVEYKKSNDEDLKKLLIRCSEAVEVLIEINEDKFKAI